MNDLHKPNRESLVPAQPRDLAPVTAANPLVARGLADITRAYGAIAKPPPMELSPSALPKPYTISIRGNSSGPATTAVNGTLPHLASRTQADALTGPSPNWLIMRSEAFGIKGAR